MVLARVAEYLNLSSHHHSHNVIDVVTSQNEPSHTIFEEDSREESANLEEDRHPYVHVMLGGGFGGLAGDMLMHSLDTVKTRQQGDPHRPAKYVYLAPSYRTIFRQEGIPRGLYGGVTPAAIGSFAGTSLFFGGYELSKRIMIDNGVAPSVAYFTAGLFADLFAAPLYVPSEVLKTRLQLQGRYNNPHFFSGYNYRSTWDAARTIVRTEGVPALFHGFRATLYRDLPFSAIQFAFYEKEREWAKYWMGSKNIGIPLEILTGAAAGGLAGTITCPLDVVKTRIQTQIRGQPVKRSQPKASVSPQPVPIPIESQTRPIPQKSSPPTHQTRLVSTSSSTSSILKTNTVKLETDSVWEGLKIIHKSEGVGGLFRGVGPRGVWTSVQSGAMFLLYQTILGLFNAHPLVEMG